MTAAVTSMESEGHPGGEETGEDVAAMVVTSEDSETMEVTETVDALDMELVISEGASEVPFTSPVPPEAGLLPPATTSLAAPPVSSGSPSGSSRRPSAMAPVAVLSQPSGQTNAAVPSSRSSSKSKKKKAQHGANLAAANGSQGAQGENTGRWTAEEHRLFLQGLEQHGKGWKKIASLIKSRTVVQIRTHAQKYFQKLAKARQNGEEGDVTMEGLRGASSVTSVSSAAAAQTTKRRRQNAGTKRKTLHSIVVSAQRQGKKMAAAQAAAGVPNPVPPLPTVAPALAHFILPHHATNNSNKNGNSSSAKGNANAPALTTSQGNISGPALEDSLFRFLTPVPPMRSESQVNEVARQAGANPITVPTENPSAAPTIAGGEISPTGVLDLAIYPSWTDAKDPPSWYSKGADVDALLDVADTLDWLADSGDLNESYQAPEMEEEDEPNLEQVVSAQLAADLSQTTAKNRTSVSSLPRVDSNMESVVPPLPSLFEGTPKTSDENFEPETEKLLASSSDAQLDVTVDDGIDEEHLQVFDTPMEEHDFVSTILESTNECSESLPVLS